MVRIAFEKRIIKKLESVRVRLEIKTTSVPETIEKLCDRVFELNNIVKNTIKTSKKHTLLDLFKQLLYLEKNTTKKKKVMFFILKEVSNNRTVFLKSVMNRLSWIKPCSTQEAQNLIRKLERLGLISIIKRCPNCITFFNFLPHQCAKCGHKFIQQKITFKDKRLRPRYAIKITDTGRLYIKEIIESYRYINSFLRTLNNYIRLKSIEYK
jgi:hypothetical protein